MSKVIARFLEPPFELWASIGDGAEYGHIGTAINNVKHPSTFDLQDAKAIVAPPACPHPSDTPCCNLMENFSKRPSSAGVEPA